MLITFCVYFEGFLCNCKVLETSFFLKTETPESLDFAEAYET